MLENRKGALAPHSQLVYLSLVGCFPAEPISFSADSQIYNFFSIVHNSRIQYTDIVYFYFMETKVISARVPLDIANMFENACKQKGITKSKYLGEILTTPLPVTATMAAGGETDIPDEVNQFISLVGGAGIGLLVYKLMQAGLPDERFSKAEKDAYSAVLAIAAGFISGYGINKLIR